MFFFFLGSGLIATLPDCWMRQVDGGCWIRDVDWMRFGLTASSIARKNAENDDRGGEIGGRGGGGGPSPSMPFRYHIGPIRPNTCRTVFFAKHFSCTWKMAVHTDG